MKCWKMLMFGRMLTIVIILKFALCKLKNIFQIQRNPEAGIIQGNIDRMPTWEKMLKMPP